MLTIPSLDHADILIGSLLPQDGDLLHAGPLAAHSRESVAQMVQTLLEWARRDRGWALTVRRDGLILGYGQLLRWGTQAEISDLVVCESQRGRGIGTQLILALLKLAHSKGYPSVEIGVAEANPRALALYLRLGFAIVRTVTLDLGSGPEPVIYLSRSTEIDA